MLWPLAVVLLFVGACAWAAKRWMPKTLRNSINAGGALHILARQSLSTKQSLCLVRVGRRLVLTGISPDQITALAEFLPTRKKLLRSWRPLRAKGRAHLRPCLRVKSKRMAGRQHSRNRHIDPRPWIRNLTTQSRWAISHKRALACKSCWPAFAI
ncbi:MAG: FliO/MopB family protein [Planctomycetes bacterium]|nr:FliO/MopB family protein [Planctomycetota bacterium]